MKRIATILTALTLMAAGPNRSLAQDYASEEETAAENPEQQAAESETGPETASESETETQAAYGEDVQVSEESEAEDSTENVAEETVAEAQAAPRPLWGIGVEVRVEQDGSLSIGKLLPGSPAARSGRLKKGDRIVAIDKGDGKLVSTAGMSLDQVIKLMRGAKGTAMRLKTSAAGDPEKTSLARLTRSLEIDLGEEIYEKRGTFEHMAALLEDIQTEDSVRPTLRRVLAKNFPRAVKVCDAPRGFSSCLYKTLATFENAEALRLGLSKEDAERTRESLQSQLKDPGLLFDPETISLWSGQKVAPADRADLRLELRRQAKSHAAMARHFQRLAWVIKSTASGRKPKAAPATTAVADESEMENLEAEWDNNRGVF